MFGVRNDSTYDFGYNCLMPQQIAIDGLHVDDSNHPEGYKGMYLFCDPGGSDPTKSPFPYTWCQKVTVRRLATASGKKPRISPNARIEKSIVLIEGDG